MPKFLSIKHAVNAQFKKMLDTKLVLVTDLDKDALWNVYLNAFPEGTNPMFRERTSHDCNCCNRFVRAIGNVVSYIDGELVTIWDVEVEGFYQVVADAMAKFVKESVVSTIFLSEFPKAGADKTPDNYSDVIWDHFYSELPKEFVKKEDKIPSLKGQATNNYAVLKRSLTEITDYAVSQVLDLIDSKAIYKGEENKARVGQLRNLKTLHEECENKEQFYWENSLRLGEASSFRNSAIGTLLVDLSKDEELEVAVKKYEKMVAPENYKRTSAVVTQGMINKASKAITELGYEDSLHRRHAVETDITINDVIFADRSAKKQMGVLDEFITPTAKPVVKEETTEDISIEDFISTVVPQAETLELLFKNSHIKNIMSLVAPVNKGCLPITKWSNGFSWSYYGEIADSSMRQQVVEKGGRVDGVFRFTHSWNHDGNNQSLMDLHVFLPSHEGFDSKKCHDNYGNAERVGWNHRNHKGTQGIQDVDFTEAPGKTVPVENITFPELSRLRDGIYPCRIHNWRSRQNPTSGFKAEIEFEGQIFQYDYPTPMAHKEWVDVANVTLKGGSFSIEHLIPTENSSKEIYGIDTESYRKVKMVMNSPNYWDCVENPKGNKHYFFILDECKNPDDVRGFYNEFLADDLYAERKVFEHLSSKLKVPFSENQLSGLGFSETIDNEITVRVRGTLNKTFNVVFNK